MSAVFALKRIAETPLSTHGELWSADGATKLCEILERGPSNPTHPRIPAGTYDVTRRPLGFSHFDAEYRSFVSGYKGIPWLPHVDGRSAIEVHCANIYQELLGCIATGESFYKTTDGNFGVFKSQSAYSRVYPILSEAIDSGGAQFRITDPEGV